MSFFRRISISVLIASLLILGCISIACNATEPSITIEQSDEADIYSSVIRQIYTHTTFNRTYQPPKIYIINYTDDTAGDPRANHSVPILISEPVQSEITTALDDLPTEIVWVNSSDKVAKDSWGTVLDGGAIIILGNIHLKADNSVQVPGSYYMAMDGGRWETYVLEFIEDVWTVTGNTGAITVS
jgi:hypothetical protein